MSNNMRDCEAGRDEMEEYLDPGEDIGRQWRTLGSPVLPGVENNLGNIMIGAKMRKFNDRRKNETNEQK